MKFISISFLFISFLEIFFVAYIHYFAVRVFGEFNIIDPLLIMIIININNQLLED